MKKDRLAADPLNELFTILSDLPLLEEDALNVQTQFGTLSITRRSGVGTPIELNSGQVTFHLLDNAAEFADPSEVSTTLSLLPRRLLNHKNAMNDHVLYERSAADAETVTSFESGRFPMENVPVVSVDIRSAARAARSATAEFVLRFNASNNETHVCAKWDAANDVTLGRGGWLVSQCLYLGSADGEQHLCQCRSTGIFALFRLGSAGPRRHQANQTPLVIATATFLLLTIGLVATFYVYPCCCQPLALVRFQSQWIENRILLQMLVSWSLFLVLYLCQRHVDRPSIVCVVLTTFTLFFLLASLYWTAASVIYQRMLLNSRPIANESFFLMEMSFITWGCPSMVFVFIPVYDQDKRKDYQTAHFGYLSCCLEDWSELLAMIVAITVISAVTLATIAGNVFVARRATGWRMTFDRHTVHVLNACSVSLAALLAALSNSRYESVPLDAAFCVFSCLFGLCLLFNYRQLSNRPMLEPNSMYNECFEMRSSAASSNSTTVLTDRHI